MKDRTAAKIPRILEVYPPSVLRFVYFDVMWHSRFTTAVLIAVWLLTPNLLCLIPGVEWTADEHECCEKMGSDCGKIPMPDMHSCCRSTTPSQSIIVARTADDRETKAMLAHAIPDLDPQYANAHAGHWLHFERPTFPPLISRDSFEILRI